ARGHGAVGESAGERGRAALDDPSCARRIPHKKTSAPTHWGLSARPPSLAAGFRHCGTCANRDTVPGPASRVMNSRRIEKTGEEIPVIGLGTWRTFDIASDRARQPLVDVIRHFSEAGGRLIDTSPMYGKAEEVVGAMRSHVKEPFIATKVWTRG